MNPRSAPDPLAVPVEVVLLIPSLPGCGKPFVGRPSRVGTQIPRSPARAIERPRSQLESRRAPLGDHPALPHRFIDAGTVPGRRPQQQVHPRAEFVGTLTPVEPKLRVTPGSVELLIQRVVVVVYIRLPVRRVLEQLSLNPELGIGHIARLQPERIHVEVAGRSRSRRRREPFGVYPEAEAVFVAPLQGADVAGDVVVARRNPDA